MHIKVYIVLAEAYRRYRRAASLLQQVDSLLEKCALDGPFPIFDFREVIVFTILNNDAVLVNIQDLTEKACEAVFLLEEFECNNSEDLKARMIGQTCVCVSSYEELLTLTNIRSYFGTAVLFIFDPIQNPDASRPHAENMLKNISEVVSVTPMSKVAKELDSLLERLVCKSIYPKINLLGSCLGFKYADFMHEIARVNYYTEELFRYKVNNLHTPADHVAWNETQLEVINNILQHSYGTEGKEIICTLFTRKQPNQSENFKRVASLSLEQATPSSTTIIADDVQKDRDTLLSTTCIQKHTMGVKENDKEIKHVFDEWMDVYRRISAPENTGSKHKILSEDVARMICSVKGVIGCGTSSRSSVVQINIDTSLSYQDRQQSEDELKQILKSNRVRMFEFHNSRRNILNFAELTASTQNMEKQNHSEDEQTSMKRLACTPALKKTYCQAVKKRRNPYVECKTVYSRNKEMEKSMTHTSLLSEQIQDVNGVLECRFQLSTLLVYIDESLPAEVRTQSEDKLRQIIARNDIQNYKFHLAKIETIRLYGCAVPLPPLF